MPEETKKKKRALVSNIRIGGGSMDVDALRKLATSEPENFMQRAGDLIDGGELRWQKVRSLRRLFDALSDVQVETEVELIGGPEPITRSIKASAFPLLSGGLTAAGINDAFEAVPTIGDQLVTEVEDNKKTSVYASIVSTNPDVDGVPEGEDFPLIGAGEEKYTILSKRNGRRMTITSEMIEENDIAGIVDRCNALGRIAATTIEKQTLRRVCDIDGSAAAAAEPYALRLNNVATTLYTTTVNNPGTRAPLGTRINNNALTDESDLDAARTRLAAMLDDLGDRLAIPMSECILLVPDELIGVASKILNSEYVSGVENELSNWGPRGQWRPRPLSTPRLSSLSTTAWYLGQFNKQFTRKWKLRFEYVTLSGNTMEFLKNRQAFAARIAWDCEIGARGYERVVQCLSGTAAPTP